ncbi:MAG: hypothetical protein ACTSPG_06175 [Candidatus Hodarchaeales archaeon]
MSQLKRKQVFLYIIILILLITLNTVKSERPAWLLTVSELPVGWRYDVEIQIKERYILSIYPTDGVVFTIETLEFHNSSLASEYVIEKYSGWNSTDQLEYIFYNDKINQSWVDVGVTWEVKSPCCYSKGVLFSIDYIIIDIFGSQKSTWDQVKIIYSVQLIKLLNFLGKPVPSQLYIDISGFSSSHSILGFPFSIALLSGVVLGLSSIHKKKLKSE